MRSGRELGRRFDQKGPSTNKRVGSSFLRRLPACACVACHGLPPWLACHHRSCVHGLRPLVCINDGLFSGRFPIVSSSSLCGGAHSAQQCSGRMMLAMTQGTGLLIIRYGWVRLWWIPDDLTNGTLWEPGNMGTWERGNVGTVEGVREFGNQC